MGGARFATLSDGTFVTPLNRLRRHQDRLRRAQQSMSRKRKFSQNWRKAKTRGQRIHTRIGHVRGDYLHQLSHTISQNSAMVCIEDLPVRNMFRSASGTVEKPGWNVRQKAELNRATLDQGWAEFRRQEENADLVGAINVLRAGHARFACKGRGAARPPAAGTHRSDLRAAPCRA